MDKNVIFFHIFASYNRITNNDITRLLRASQ